MEWIRLRPCGRWEQRRKKDKKKDGSHVWRGGWRASRNGGWEWEFGGVWKMEVKIEALLELVFSQNL
jgi:hypothetical protein